VAKDISLSLVRAIKAPPEKVFDAWLRPETLKRWMAPSEAMEVTVAETDPRVGGRYRLVMREPDGREHNISGTYWEIVPARKLVFTWNWDGGPDVETLVTLNFRDKGGATELTLTHTKFADEEARDMHNDGWMGCVGRLEKLFAA
jgi:uncharacterized protein YndB with AHSA1/START domain